MDNQKSGEREYLERIPFVTELLKRIDDISQAIRHGDTGEDEAANLLSDLPDSWKKEIRTKLDNIERSFKSNTESISKRYITGTQRSYKQQLENQRLEAGKDYSRAIKSTVINLLDSKGLLFLTRNQVNYSDVIDMHDKKSDEDSP